jgi:hypothetical protein
MAKKLQISSQKDQLSNTKLISTYKVKDQNSSIDVCKNGSSFGNKKMSLARSINGCSKTGKMM